MPFLLFVFAQHEERVKESVGARRVDWRGRRGSTSQGFVSWPAMLEVTHQLTQDVVYACFLFTEHHTTPLEAFNLAPAHNCDDQEVDVALQVSWVGLARHAWCRSPVDSGLY